MGAINLMERMMSGLDHTCSTMFSQLTVRIRIEYMCWMVGYTIQYNDAIQVLRNTSFVKAQSLSKNLNAQRVGQELLHRTPTSNLILNWN
jgi:hypothetical protein